MDITPYGVMFRQAKSVGQENLRGHDGDSTEGPLNLLPTGGLALDGDAFGPWPANNFLDKLF